MTNLLSTCNKSKLPALAGFFALLLGVFGSCSKVDPDMNPTPSGYQQYGTPFGGVPAAEDVVMYEVNLRAFSSGGDLQGVIDRLDAIADLGVNVIWLMPIHPIGDVNSVNSPYSVKDFKAVSPEYGTLDDLRRLVDEAHSRGMAVILDWVANHTAWDNAWINTPDWYTQNSSGEIIHPPGTNWMDVADLNYNNQDMRDAMIDAMTYWAYEANIDGFRCDYADGVPFGFWSAAIDSIRAIPNRQFVFFAEGSRSDHFNAGFDLNFGWGWYGALKNVYAGEPVSRIFTANNSEYSGTPAGKHWIRFTTNHDESAWDATPITLFNGVEGALAASVVTIFTAGAPLIYGSQEVGRSSTVPFFSNSPINWNANPDMRQTYEAMLQFYSSSASARKGTRNTYANPDVATIRKVMDSDEVLILANLRDSSLVYTVPAELVGSSWTDVLSGSGVTLGSDLALNPFQFYILD